jgi:Fe2+ transport system protein FeoA/GTP-binding protein EngB required for normal cell division
MRNRAQGAGDQSGSVIVLAQLAPGRQATIVGTLPGAASAVANLLRQLGFRPAARVDVIRRAPLGDPTIFRVQDTELCLRPSGGAADRGRPRGGPMTACHGVTAAPVAVAGARRVALVGSPNAGKTSVFNHLTGLRAKTGNYPGVTVGRSVGTTHVDGVTIAVEDLPGTYSLDLISPDEQVVTDLLAGALPDIDPPDAIVLVADATTLRRSIMLVAQVLRLDLPCLLALTMGDELTSRGGRIDVEALSTALGIPVTAVIAHRGSGIEPLRAQLGSFEQWQRPPILPPSDYDAIDAWGRSVLDAADYVAPQPDQRTSRIDRVLLHPLWGTVVFFAVMFGFLPGSVHHRRATAGLG